jgi:hypothetical protein
MVARPDVREAGKELTEYCYVHDDVTCSTCVMGTTKQFYHKDISCRETRKDTKLKMAAVFPSLGLEARTLFILWSEMKHFCCVFSHFLWPCNLTEVFPLQWQ